MGLRNMRAKCPACGGKLHTQAKGLGHLSLWGNSWFMTQTGPQCQWCGVALTGKVKANHMAELANPPEPVERPQPPAVPGVDWSKVRNKKMRAKLGVPEPEHDYPSAAWKR